MGQSYLGAQVFNGAGISPLQKREETGHPWSNVIMSLVPKYPVPAPSVDVVER